MVFGDVYFSLFYKEPVTRLRKALTEYAEVNGFGIHFLKHWFLSDPEKETSAGKIRFQLSDSFIAPNCDEFLDVIYNTPEGDLLPQPLLQDLVKLKGLTELIFSSDAVDFLEFRFSCPEADEWEYKVYHITPSKMIPSIFKAYVEKTDIPTAKFIITREEEPPREPDTKRNTNTARLFFSGSNDKTFPDLSPILGLQADVIKHKGEPFSKQLGIYEPTNVWGIRSMLVEDGIRISSVSDFFEKHPTILSEIEKIKRIADVHIRISVTSFSGQILYRLSAQDMAILCRLGIPVDFSATGKSCLLSVADTRRKAKKMLQAEQQFLYGNAAFAEKNTDDVRFIFSGSNDERFPNLSFLPELQPNFIKHKGEPLSKQLGLCEPTNVWGIRSILVEKGKKISTVSAFFEEHPAILSEIEKIKKLADFSACISVVSLSGRIFYRLSEHDVTLLKQTGVPVEFSATIV